MADVATERIVKTPGTCGGKARIAGHRIRVLDVVHWSEHAGLTPREIVEYYPSITVEDVEAALAYYHAHPEEIREEVRREEEIAERYRAQHPSRVEEKLRARRHQVPA